MTTARWFLLLGVAFLVLRMLGGPNDLVAWLVELALIPVGLVWTVAELTRPKTA